jgi:hypothetical protein
MGPLEVVVLLATLATEEPPSIARLRFPPNAVAVEAYKQATDFRYMASDRMTYSLSAREREQWEAVHKEAEWCYQCWYCIWLSDDRAEEQWRGNDQCWKTWMEKLRCLLGDEAYMAGQMPYPIPAWAER